MAYFKGEGTMEGKERKISNWREEKGDTCS